jgi:hypothetical protein
MSYNFSIHTYILTFLSLLYKGNCRTSSQKKEKEKKSRRLLDSITTGREATATLMGEKINDRAANTCNFSWTSWLMGHLRSSPGQPKEKRKLTWAQTLPDFRKTGLWGGKDDGHSMFWLSSWLNGLAPAAMFPQLYKHSKSHRAGRADK